VHVDIEHPNPLTMLARRSRKTVLRRRNDANHRRQHLRLSQEHRASKKLFRGLLVRRLESDREAGSARRDFHLHVVEVEPASPNCPSSSPLHLDAVQAHEHRQRRRDHQGANRAPESPDPKRQCRAAGTCLTARPRRNSVPELARDGRLRHSMVGRPALGARGGAMAAACASAAVQRQTPRHHRWRLLVSSGRQIVLFTIGAWNALVHGGRGGVVLATTRCCQASSVNRSDEANS
jgi:hypothetical protein